MTVASEMSGLKLVCLDKRMLQVHWGAAPTLWFYVRDRLSKVPSMAMQVLSVVLTFTIRVIRRFRQDSGACLSRALAVTQRVLDTYLHRNGMVGSDIAFGDRNAALTGAHLDSVIGNT